MKAIRYIAILLFRIWFYVLVTVPILLMFPLLLLSILRERWYPWFFRLARLWARIILLGMGFRPRVRREVHYIKNASYMFVANHTSMVDIMLMLAINSNPFVFVGKKELARIPVFGFFYRRTCILVDRSKVKSRHNVFIESQKRLNQGLSVCIFPEGGVPDDDRIVLDEFKDGAFRLAIEHRIPVAPMTFHDNKKRFPYTFHKGGPGPMRVMVHEVIPTRILELEDKRMLRNQTRDIILKELENPSL